MTNKFTQRHKQTHFLTDIPKQLRTLQKGVENHSKKDFGQNK